MRVAARKAHDYLENLSNWTERDSDVRIDVDGLLLIFHTLCEASPEEREEFFQRVEVPYK